MNDLVEMGMVGMYGNNPWRAWRLREFAGLMGWKKRENQNFARRMEISALNDSSRRLFARASKLLFEGNTPEARPLERILGEL